MNNFLLKERKLPVGLQSILLPRKEGQSVTFLVLIGVGARYETKKQSGLSHFLEHMFFKGTENRVTAKEIAEAVDNIGGEFNAFTGEEYTGYYVKVSSEHLERGADVVSDILLRPLFPKEEIERERGVIIEEINMYTETPMQHVWHLWNKAMFGDHPLGRRVDGSIDVVSQLQREDFSQYVDTHYNTGNAAVIVAGNFDELKTEALLDKLFASLSVGKATKPDLAPTSIPAERLVFERREALDQTHLMVGVPGISLEDKRRWATELMVTILGSGMSSRLFSSIRERRGLAYAVRMSADSYTDTGSLVTQAGVKTSNAEEAVKLIMEEYDRIMREPVSTEELKKAKEMARGHMVLGLEGTNSLALFAGIQQVLTGKIDSPSEILEKINEVTVKDIQKVAQDLLVPEKRAIAVLGPQKTDREFVKIIKK